jgi:hypothetical protein
VAAESLRDRQQLFTKAARTRLSRLRDDGGPELVIACTANINASREVPPGRGGFCLAFDPHKVTLRGDPRSGERDIAVGTTDYEHLLGHTRFTLFDIVAISGAAFSPLMGAATRGAYRIVMTLTNLRLGVWLPHPTVVSGARAYLQALQGDDEASLNARREREQDSWWTRRTSLLLLWYVARHPFWHRDPEKQERREAWLWAHVLKAREDSTRGGRQSRARARLRAAVCWRMMQPTLGLLWAEAAGHTSYRATWVNVTDGGHYDNLGLVEALRRQADNILVLDASGDSAHTWFTLGGAMSLARADAQVDITLDPKTMVDERGAGPAPKLLGGQVLRPWARGTFTRSGDLTSRGAEDPGARQAANGQTAANGQRAEDGQQTPSGQQTAHGQQAADGHQSANGQAAGDGHQTAGERLWVCKLGWWDGAPWDIRAYAAGHPSYPCDSTLQQLYDSAEFDAYHELGACAVDAAATHGGLPLNP